MMQEITKKIFYTSILRLDALTMVYVSNLTFTYNLHDFLRPYLLFLFFSLEY